MPSIIEESDLSEDQKPVYQAICDWIEKGKRVHGQTDPKLLTLGGYAGVGKTSLVSILARRLQNTYRISFCALTGKAAGVLRKKLEAAGVINRKVLNIQTFLYSTSIQRLWMLMDFVGGSIRLRRGVRAPCLLLLGRTARACVVGPGGLLWRRGDPMNSTSTAEKLEPDPDPVCPCCEGVGWVHPGHFLGMAPALSLVCPLCLGLKQVHLKTGCAEEG